MALHPAIAADPAELDAEARIAAAAACQRAQALRQLEVLGTLVDVGLQLALAVEREARRLGEATSAPEPQAPEPEAPEPEASEDAPAQSPAPDRATLQALSRLSMAYARTARALRVTLMLQARMMQDFAAAETLAARAAPAEQARRRQAGIEDRKRRVTTIVRRVGADRGMADEALHALMLDAPERLDDELVFGDLLIRPIGALVARLCRDLGLDPDWTRLAEEAWAEEEIAAAPPGSPFLGLAQADPPVRPPAHTYAFVWDSA